MSKMGQLYLEIQEEMIKENMLHGKIKYDIECNYCVSHYKQHAPYHFASDRCESGKRDHCTCDICF